jgi:hypothetical protein
MAKNFASIYSGGNDSSALNQSFFLKLETVRGTAVIPTGTDFLFTLGGGAVNFTQPYESSPHRSGRHNNNVIKQKTATEWSFSTLLNIKQGVVYSSCVDVGMKLLWKSLLGKETDTTSSYEYDSSIDPAITFTICENLDHMAKQASGAFVQQCEASFPGDGMAQLNWSGNAKTTKHAGIGKSITDNDTTNTVTLGVGEGKRFDVGAMVMIVEADGVTRSADTATARKITAITGDVITIDGAVLADADGSGLNAPIYLCYWEPTGVTIVGIDEPQTGLVGSVSIDTLPTLSCVRSATITMANNHELQDYCYGSDSLSGALFIPGGRLDVTVSLEMNLNASLVEFMKRIRDFEAHDIQLICGEATNRHLVIDLPKVIFNVPAIPVPDTGSVPVSFEGMALQTALEAADEVTVTYI